MYYKASNYVIKWQCRLNDWHEGSTQCFYLFLVMMVDATKTKTKTRTLMDVILVIIVVVSAPL